MFPLFHVLYDNHVSLFDWTTLCLPFWEGEIYYSTCVFSLISSFIICALAYLECLNIAPKSVKEIETNWWGSTVYLAWCTSLFIPTWYKRKNWNVARTVFAIVLMQRPSSRIQLWTWPVSDTPCCHFLSICSVCIQLRLGTNNSGCLTCTWQLTFAIDCFNRMWKKTKLAFIKTLCTKFYPDLY